MGNCCCGSDNVNLFPPSNKAEKEFQREFRTKINRGESEFANYILFKIQEYIQTGKDIKICLEIHKPSRHERMVVINLLNEQFWGVRLKVEKFVDGVRYNERVDLEEQEFRNYIKNLAVREVKNLDINDINYDYDPDKNEDEEQTEEETEEGTEEEEGETGEGETQEDSDNAEVKINEEQDNQDTESNGTEISGDNGDDDADLEAAIRLSRCAAQSPIASPMLSPLASPRVSKSPRPSRSPRPSQVNLTVNVTASPRGPLSPRISNEKIDITEEIIKHKYIKMRYWLLYRIKQ